jgi:two-component system, NtrC family, response regulator AtoC
MATPVIPTHDDVTERAGPDLAPRADERRLRVMSAQGISVFALPASGVVVIGRGDDVDLRVDDPSISRRHARLHVGAALAIEDLGSANGTRVRDVRLTADARVEVSPGDVVELGKALCLVQGPARAGAPTAPWSEGYLAARLDESATAPRGAAAQDILVEDPAMRRLHALVGRVARGDIHVLLLGETGAGKEVFAARVHALSARAEKPFVKFNCAALTESLLESELFGHEKGAFTGAVSAKPGLLESAQGGTVFLDEVGELTPGTQAKLLRVLEDHKARRVGSLKEIALDLRFVAATNRDLEAEVAAGRFREDLYFRLNGFSLVIPPLRDRGAEILPLAARFATLARRRAGASGTVEFSTEAQAMLTRHRWPGNVRELRNVMERAVLLAEGDVITPEHLPLEWNVAPRPARPAAGALEPIARVRNDAEREHILTALEHCAGNQTRAARLLGISRRVLVDRLEKYGIPRPRKGRDEP